MNSFVDLLVPIAVLAVAIVLVAGTCQHAARRQCQTRRNSLMRLRVVLQFVAIIVIMGVDLVAGRLALRIDSPRATSSIRPY